MVHCSRDDSFVLDHYRNPFMTNIPTSGSRDKAEQERCILSLHARAVCRLATDLVCFGSSWPRGSVGFSKVDFRVAALKY